MSYPPPRAVTAQFPDPVGLPLPLGLRGLRVLLVSLDPSSIHDAFLAAHLVGDGGGAVELWLDPSVSGEDAATGAVNLATAHAAGWRQAAAAGSITFRMQKITDGLSATDDNGGFHIVACTALTTSHQTELAEQELATSLRAIYTVLRPGGELFVSLPLCNHRLNVPLDTLEAAGIGYILYFEDLVKALQHSQFLQPRVLKVESWEAGDEEAQQLLLVNSRVSVFHLRAAKNRLLEPTCEDYGQIVVYRGTIEGADDAYTLDSTHTFAKKRPTTVCGNTAAMLGEDSISWLCTHFIVSGDRSVHFGAFSGRHGPQRGPIAASDYCCM